VWRQKDFTNSARTVQKDNQILIPYDWVKRKVFYKLTDYKPEKLFRRQIQHVVENSEEYISNDDIEEKQEDDKQEQPDNADDDYNEDDDDDDDDDDDGNDNNSNYFDNDLNNKHFII
jgi:phosphopantothenoylcysteine synthetase/decarboxylase